MLKLLSFDYQIEGSCRGRGVGGGGGVVDVLIGIKTEKTNPNTIDVALGALIFHS